MQKSNVVSVVSNFVTLSHYHIVTPMSPPLKIILHCSLGSHFSIPPHSVTMQKYENVKTWQCENMTIATMATMWRLVSAVQCKMQCSAACSALMGGRWHFDSVWQENRRHTTSVHCVHQRILYRLVWHFDSVAEEQNTIVYSALPQPLLYSVTSVTFWRCEAGTQKTHSKDTNHQCMCDRITEEKLV